MRVSLLIVLLSVAACFVAASQQAALEPGTNSVSHEVIKNADGSVTVTATAVASVNVPAQAGASADPLRVGAVLGGPCSSGTRSGICQVDSGACAGGYVSGACPGTANNVRCCLRPITTTPTQTCSSGGRSGVCQVDSISCGGGYVSGACPGTPGNVRCCLSGTTPPPPTGGSVPPGWTGPLPAIGGPGGPYGPRALAWAQSQIGVREVNNANRGTQVELYQTSNGGKVGEAWCGHFVAWCYRQAGSAAPQRQRWNIARYVINAPGVTQTSNPQPGDLVVFTGLSHVGMYESTLSSTTFTTVEGNTYAGGSRDEGVYRRTKSRSQVAYFLRVAN